jgi:site-specific DNA-methyltransferase (adenine-specific)
MTDLQAILDAGGPWQQARIIGGQLLIQGDCREVMTVLPKVDAVVTDPPYGLKGAETEKNDYSTFSDDPAEVERLVKHVIAWGNFDRLVMTPGQKMMFKYPEPSAVGVFYYPAGTGSCSWGFVGFQPIFYYGKDPILQDRKGRASNCFYSTESAEKNGHPCPKPIGQWSRLLQRVSRLNETILDPFMGSGTTLVACQRLGRQGIGIELDESYFAIACKRVQEVVNNPPLFVPAPPKPTQDTLDL